jgi:hypothetical protein
LARFVKGIEQGPRKTGRQKGIRNMPGTSIKRTIIAISAALAASTMTIGATVSPAQAGTIQLSGAAHG